MIFTDFPLFFPQSLENQNKFSNCKCKTKIIWQTIRCGIECLHLRMVHWTMPKNGCVQLNFPLYRSVCVYLSCYTETFTHKHTRTCDCGCAVRCSILAMAAIAANSITHFLCFSHVSNTYTQAHAHAHTGPYSIEGTWLEWSCCWCCYCYFCYCYLLPNKRWATHKNVAVIVKRKSKFHEKAHIYTLYYIRYFFI